MPEGRMLKGMHHRDLLIVNYPAHRAGHLNQEKTYSLRFAAGCHSSPFTERGILADFYKYFITTHGAGDFRTEDFVYWPFLTVHWGTNSKCFLIKALVCSSNASIFAVRTNS